MLKVSNFSVWCIVGRQGRAWGADGRQRNSETTTDICLSMFRLLFISLSGYWRIVPSLFRLLFISFSLLGYWKIGLFLFQDIGKFSFSLQISFYLFVSFRIFENCSAQFLIVIWQIMKRAKFNQLQNLRIILFVVSLISFIFKLENHIAFYIFYVRGFLF